MNNRFDELAKGVAQTVTRREALKKFGVGVIGVALGCFGLATGAKAAKKTCLPRGSHCGSDGECCSGICEKGKSGGYYGLKGAHYSFCY